MEPIERRVEAFLAKVESPVPLKERCAHAIANQSELVTLIRELLQYLAGQGEAHMMLAGKATRLCDALRPLLTPSRVGGQHLVDEFVHGTAPRLKAAFADLEAELEQS